MGLIKQRTYSLNGDNATNIEGTIDGLAVGMTSSVTNNILTIEWDTDMETEISSGVVNITCNFIDSGGNNEMISRSFQGIVRVELPEPNFTISESTPMQYGHQYQIVNTNDKIYVHGSLNSTTLFTSTDGSVGNTTTINSQYCYSMIVTNTGRILISNQHTSGPTEYHGFIFSDDNGVTWGYINQDETAGWRALFQTNTGRILCDCYIDIMSNSYHGLSYSDDNGETGYMGYNFGYDEENNPILITNIGTTNQNRIIISTDHGIGYSDDNGITCTQISSTTGTGYNPITLPTNRIIVTKADSDGLGYSDDNGITGILNDAITGQFRSLAVGNNGRIFIGGAQDNGIMYSDDYANTWKQSNITNGTGYEIRILDNNKVIAIGDNGIAYSLT